MAYAIGTPGDAAQTATASSLGCSVTYAAHDRAVVAVTWDDAAGAIAVSISDGTNTYAHVDAGNTNGLVHDATGGQYIQYFECLDCAAGTFTVTASFPGGADFVGIQVSHASGLSNTIAAVFAGQAIASSNTTTDGISSGNLTPGSQPGALLGWGISDAFGIASVSAGTGFTDDGQIASWFTAFSTHSRLEDKRLTATTAVAATFTDGAGTGSIFAIAIFIPEPTVGTFPPVPSQFVPHLYPLIQM